MQKSEVSRHTCIIITRPRWYWPWKCNCRHIFRI